MAEEEKEKIDFDSISDRHKAFCKRYVYDWNGTQSYLEIYPNSSYDAAKSSAADLLTNPSLLAYIEFIQEDLAKLSGISALKNIQELSKIAYTDLTDFKDGWMTERDFDSLTDDQKGALSEIQYIDKSNQHGSEKIVKFKVHDKMKALEMINKMLGFDAAEKVDLTTKGDKLQAGVTVLTRNYQKSDAD